MSVTSAKNGSVLGRHGRATAMRPGGNEALFDGERLLPLRSCFASRPERIVLETRRGPAGPVAAGAKVAEGESAKPLPPDWRAAHLKLRAAGVNRGLIPWETVPRYRRRSAG